MSEIPADIMAAAEQAYLEAYIQTNAWAGREAIARAILAERERCALQVITETKAPPQRNAKGQWVEQVGMRLAESIRKGPQP